MREPVDASSWHTYPSMVAIVTSKHFGKQNVMASGWHTFMATNPGHYGIAIRKETYTYELIQQSAVFAVQFLPAAHSEQIQACGTFSGREIDKFSTFSIPFEPGIKVDVPVLSDAYFAYECKVVGQHTYGTHEWFVGEVVQSYRDKHRFTDTNAVDFNGLEIPMYIGRSEYRILTTEAPQKFHPMHLKKQ